MPDPINITQIPAPRVELIDPRTGLVSREWFRFFNNIYTIVGSDLGVIQIINGGTGLSTYPTNGQLLIGDTVGQRYVLNTLAAGSGIGVTNGAGTIGIANTGVLSNAAGVGISVSSATGNVTITNTGVLSFSGGSTGLTPSTDNTGAITLAGTLDVNNGGTGQTTYTNGQLLIGNSTGNTLTKSTLTAGTAISITNGAGAITVTNTLPDQTVALASGTGISVTGTYPSFTITNTSPSSGGTVTAVTGTAPIASSGGTTPAISISQSNTTTDGYLSSTDWNIFNNKQPAGTYVTSISVTSSNGLAGTVTSGATPAITLSTSITGILKGNGTAISAATSGTDYAPATSGTSILYGDGSGGFSNVTIGTGVSFVAGTLSATGSGGTVTSVTGTSPVVSSGGTTPAISLASGYGDTQNPYASKTANYVLAAPNGSAGAPTFRALVAADVPALSYVTSVGGTGTVNGITLTGTVTSSGNLTLGGTLGGIGNSQLTNSTISGVALGGNLFNLTAGTGVSFSSGTTYNGSAAITITATGSGGTVTSVAALTLGTTGTDLSSTVANGTTTPVITLQVPTASATNRGALSAADWTTFNSKAPGVTFTTGYVPFGQGTTTLNQDAALFWDNTNKRLGVGTTTPSVNLQIAQSVNGATFTATTLFKIIGSPNSTTNQQQIIFTRDRNPGVKFASVAAIGLNAYSAVGTNPFSQLTFSLKAVSDNTDTTDIDFLNLRSDRTARLLAANAGSSSVVFESANTPSAATITGTDAGSTNGQLSFLTSNSGTSTEWMRINSLGRVGIVITTPAARFDVNLAGSSVSEVNTPIARFYGNNGGGAVQNLAGLAIYNNLSGGFVDSGLVYGNTTNSYLTFGHYNGTTYAERMRISATGGVSIGNTTDPGAGGLRVSGLMYPQQAATASAPAYVKGAIYFDTTLNKLRVGGATAWETITSV